MSMFFFFSRGKRKIYPKQPEARGNSTGNSSVLCFLADLLPCNPIPFESPPNVSVTSINIEKSVRIIKQSFLVVFVKGRRVFVESYSRRIVLGDTVEMFDWDSCMQMRWRKVEYVLVEKYSGLVFFMVECVLWSDWKFWEVRNTGN